jgi:hypothetical protein
VSYEFPDERHYQDFTAEQEDDAMMPEINEAIKQTFSRVEFPVVLSCGDDRIVAPASIKELSGHGLPMDRPFLRLFGGKYGAANILAVATTAQYGPKFTKDKLGHDFHKMAHEVAGRAADLNIHMVSHSSLDAETKQGPLGCARISALGKLNQMSAKDQLSIRVAEVDSESLFGISGQESGFHEVPPAFAMASHIYFGSQPQDYSITRKDIAREPVMVLAGGHADPETDGVIHVVNLQKDRVSDVNEAVTRGLYYYDSDVTIVAETLMRSFPELHLDPRFLLNSMLLDQSATRAALAASRSGAADPQRIPSQRYGDGREALDYLSSL